MQRVINCPNNYASTVRMRNMKIKRLIIALLIISLPIITLNIVSTANNESKPNLLYSIKSTFYSLSYRTFGEPYINYGRSVVQAFDEGYLIVGDSYYPQKSYDITVMKVDKDGYQVWNQTYGGEDVERGKSVVLTEDGGFLIIGDTYSYGMGSYDVWVLKADGNGFITWNLTIGTNRSDAGVTAIQTTEGDYVGVGRYNRDKIISPNIIEANRDIWVFKISKNGTLIWNQTYGGLHVDYPTDIIATPDGGYLVLGASVSYGTGGSDWWVLKLDSNGSVVWDQIYDGLGNACANGALQTADGGYLLVGETGGEFLGTSPDIWGIKINDIGMVEWEFTYGDTDLEVAMSAIQIPDGSFLITGYLENDLIILKIQSNGRIEGSQLLTGPEEARGYKIIHTQDCGFAIVGTAIISRSEGTRMLLVKGCYSTSDCHLFPYITTELSSNILSTSATSLRSSTWDLISPFSALIALIYLCKHFHKD